MMHRYKLLILIAIALLPVNSYAQLVLTGAIDGPLPGGQPKAIELCAMGDIADLSLYGLESAGNGSPAVAPEMTFPAVSVSAGEFIYVTGDSADFHDFFGFAADYNGGGATFINGDDTIVLWCDGNIIDNIGEIGVDGTGRPWEHLDGWIYRVSGTGPDGAAYVEANWTVSGINALDGETSNDTAQVPFPIGTYTHATVAVEEKSWSAIKGLYGGQEVQ